MRFTEALLCGFVGWAENLPMRFNEPSAWANKNILPTLPSY